MDSLEMMLTNQLKLQHKLGHEFGRMTDDERVEYIKEMYIATTIELAEALGEISWKTWTTKPPSVQLLPFISELGDAFQFIMNMWFAAMPNAKPAEIAAAMFATHTAKLEVNHKRQDSGTYDGVSTKCRSCKRAREDAEVSSGTLSWTCSCGTINSHRSCINCAGTGVVNVPNYVYNGQPCMCDAGKSFREASS